MAHAGEEFQQKRGRRFTCVVMGNRLNPRTTNRYLPRSHCARALALVPLSGPGDIQHLLGPSYLYGILMEERIRANDW